MDVRIEQKPAFALAGIEEKAIQAARCPMVWDRLFQQADMPALADLGDGRSFGMCRNTDSAQRFDYLAGFEVKDRAAAADLGLAVVDIPAQRYAVARLKGPIPGCIHEGWAYLMGDYLPRQGLRHAGTPDFEAYWDGDMQSPGYEMELWVPVTEA